MPVKTLDRFPIVLKVSVLDSQFGSIRLITLANVSKYLTKDLFIAEPTHLQTTLPICNRIYSFENRVRGRPHHTFVEENARSVRKIKIRLSQQVSHRL